MPFEVVAAQSKVLDKPEVAGKCRVRSSPHNYVNALFVLTFVAGLLAFLNFELVGWILFAAAWTIVPALLWFDRIEFDGKSLRRTGALARLWRLLGQPARLKVNDIIAIETNSLRALRSGNTVYYRYRCEIFGDQQSYVIAAGGKNFRQMARRLFAVVAPEKLDLRSIELRDFLIEPDALRLAIKKLELPSSDVLENALPRLRHFKKQPESARDAQTAIETSLESEQKAAELRRAANELKVAGNLAQSIEAFRRALVRQPKNVGLLFEFARALHSYARATRSAASQRRAVAALRLAAHRAAQHAPTNAALLVRIGETYLQTGQTEGAARAFRRALEIENENFRAEIGLAEIGLQTGKIAHVVHHYNSAARAAIDDATRDWARDEAEYFALLNSDADYMNYEIWRINAATSAARARRICWRLTFVGLLAILAGTFIDAQITAVGWAIAAASLLIWTILSVVEFFLAERFPLIDDEEE